MTLAQAVQTPQVNQQVTLTQLKGKHKVLLIEDDAFLIRVYQAKMQQLNWDISIVENGLLAVESCEKYMPSVIVLDLVMPGKSGFEVLADLKANQVTKNIPVIVLSNLLQTEDEKEAMKLGAVAYLKKSEHLLSGVIDVIKKLL